MVKTSKKKAGKKLAKKKAVKIAARSSATSEKKSNIFLDAFKKQSEQVAENKKTAAAILASPKVKAVKEHNHTEEHNALPVSKLPLFLQLNLKAAGVSKKRATKKRKKKTK
jgi:hypothetical protein